jgi:hypothetical protein
MELPASHGQREQTEQATMVVLCSKQAALRNPAGRVVSLGLPGRVSMQDASEKGSRRLAEDSPLVMTSSQRSFLKDHRHLAYFYKDAKTVVFMSEDAAA